MAKITFTKIKKYLKNRSKDQLIEEMRKLFAVSSQVQEYYTARLSDAGQKDVIERYKEIILYELDPRSNGWAGIRLSVMRKAVNDYSKIAPNEIHKAEIMVYYVEQGIKCTLEYGDMYERFYVSMESMYEKAAQFIVKHHLQSTFFIRMKRMVHDTSDMGWGFHDTLGDLFEKYFPTKEL